jgi:hypothetical protein
VDHASKPAQQIVCETLSQKYPTPKKMAGGVAQGVGPEFKLQYHKKKKKKTTKVNQDCPTVATEVFGGERKGRRDSLKRQDTPSFSNSRPEPSYSLSPPYSVTLTLSLIDSSVSTRAIKLAIFTMQVLCGT